MKISLTENHLEEEPLGRILDELGPGLLSQLTKVLALLAEGRPVRIGEVAESLHVSRDEAKAWLVRFGAEFDAGGDLVGLGLTSVPTPHKFEVDGHSLYAWCAGDTLIFPVILGKTARVESTDPISGAKVRLVATPQGAEKIEPSTAMLSWPRHADSSDIRGTVCYPSLWFASRETAQKYASKNSGVTIHAPEDFRELLKVFEKKGLRVAQTEQPTATSDRSSDGPSCH